MPFSIMWKSLAILERSLEDAHTLHDLNKCKTETAMLSSLPGFIPADLSFVSDHGKDQHVDLIYNLRTGKKHALSKCDSDSLSGAPPKCNSNALSGFPSTSCSLSSVSSFSTSPKPSMSSHVYKRRKLPKNFPTDLSEQSSKCSSMESIYDSDLCSEMLTLDVKKDGIPEPNIRGSLFGVKAIDQPLPVFSNDLSYGTWKLDEKFISQSKIDIGGERRHDEGLMVSSARRLDQDLCINGNSPYSILDSDLAPTDHEAAVAGDCVSKLRGPSNIGGYRTTNEVVISTLEIYGLLGGLRLDEECASTEVYGYLMQCKICGGAENSLKMLICDMCEEACHVSCCNHRAKKIPVDDWYCQDCLRKKSKPMVKVSTMNSDKDLKENHEIWRKDSKSDVFSSMLQDTEPYDTQVRIGSAFQADVPDWSGPSLDDSDYTGVPLDIKYDRNDFLNTWDPCQSFALIRIGNWIQCREVLYEDLGQSRDKQNLKGVVCGKWRRARLSDVQTDDWDCSCSVLWDPLHADCAVPQELPTDEILEHLKYVKSLNLRMASRKQKLKQ
ncbi:uncharacterized protein LOC18440684 isoform X1 [Amborella trichopoda]|uniref:uncharacterized protein LOC18440684 isoform X1 n=2 Tax=Amborella trichopoda TaxID=13333 RepID=UPI0005D368E4|nr:uncharacterized protein LOC18440684 isoform X1 [Amborella trichopoda]XP_020526898.1 uncharacterized protein LOC18440684 isoform X1 [Amborella trichopoda]|eukprot:XP_011625731.1 uncharacterized protein LOC18440684 isoform X1 [Amborella trichopoda]